MTAHPPTRICRGCDRERESDRLVLLDIHAPTGVCWHCADYVRWDFGYMRVLGTGEDGDPRAEQ